MLLETMQICRDLGCISDLLGSQHTCSGRPHGGARDPHVSLQWCLRLHAGGRPDGEGQREGCVGAVGPEGAQPPRATGTLSPHGEPRERCKLSILSMTPTGA